MHSLCGYPPFPQSNDYMALRRVVTGSYEFYENEWKDVSEDAKDFIRALLVTDPQKRATAKKVYIPKTVLNCRRVKCDGCYSSRSEPCI